MPRIRTVRPVFFRHRLLQELQLKYPALQPMLVYEGLWCQCDKNGVFEWKLDPLSLDILPFMKIDMERALAVLAGAGFLTEFWHTGKHYGFIPTFTDHQRISGKESANDKVNPTPLAEGSTREAPENTPGSISEAIVKHLDLSREASGPHPGTSQVLPDSFPTNQESTTYPVKQLGSIREATGCFTGAAQVPRSTEYGVLNTEYGVLNPLQTQNAFSASAKTNTTDQTHSGNGKTALQAGKHANTRMEISTSIINTLQLQPTPTLLAAVSEALRHTSKRINVPEEAAQYTLLQLAYDALKAKPDLDLLGWFQSIVPSRPGVVASGWKHA